MIEVSEVSEPVARNTSRASALTVALKQLPVGKAVFVTGVTQQSASSRSRLVGLTFSPQRKFTTAKLDDGRIQILRIV